MSNWVTFRKIPDARTGNCLFQYLACKLVQLLHGCEYKPIEECDVCHGNDNGDYDAQVRVLNDETFYDNVILGKEGSLKNDCRGVLCHGYFQKGDWFCQYRDRLLDLLYSVESTEDYWIFEGRKVLIRDLLHSKHTCDFSGGGGRAGCAGVVVVSLRLDDFIQWPCPTSDIVRPTFYTDILETIVFDKLYIVCDTIRHDWERAYIEHFQKWSPVLIQESLLHDCAVMRECPVLLHSNSTLCWLMSFLGRVVGKKRYIPLTHFYPGQTLCAIDSVGDVMVDVCRMAQAEVMSLRYVGDVEKCIYPLSYSLPDEMVVLDSDICKTRIWAEINPMDRSTYRFRCGQEAEYHQQYRDAMFAYTLKKGGWDCLRHYEIMVNGCIPVFVDLDHCPRDTLTSFPKDLVREANRVFSSSELEACMNDVVNGIDAVELVDRSVYLEYRKRMLDHVRNHCTVLANARYVLRTLSLRLFSFKTPTSGHEMNENAKLPCAFPMHKGLIKPVRNVLMIRCDVGVNYTREMFWIGMKRHIDSLGNTDDGGVSGCAVEYPAMPYLYSDFPEEQIGNIHGWGYGYARRLDASTRCLDYPDDAAIMASICSHKWDLVVFGKTGPDEGYHGSIPNLPFWTEVFRHYSKDEIVFLYGGDECIDMTYGNHYRDHILKHAQYGSCFVRELRR